ncbi:MAG TPA: guanylate kinase [Longimicrobiales bacterium]
MSLKSRSFPVVIAAPSGAGKTTLARALVERSEGVVFAVSATTRPPREHEVQGRDYYFVDDREFDRMIAANELVEWAVVHGRRYGTLRREVEEALRLGQIVLLDIDVQGARQVRRVFPDAVLIFVLPPSAEELHRRLLFRGSDGEAERLRRLRNARAELPAAAEFDYVVVNDDFERAVGALQAILAAERYRVGRVVDLAGELRRLDRELAALMERRE